MKGRKEKLLLRGLKRQEVILSVEAWDWLAEMSHTKNVQRYEVMQSLIDCAMRGEVFHLKAEVQLNFRKADITQTHMKEAAIAMAKAKAEHASRPKQRAQRSKTS